MTSAASSTSRGLSTTIPASLIEGVPVDDVTTAETLELVDAFLTEGRATGRSFQIATINVDFVVKAREDPSMLRVLQRAELCLPDGMPILWYSSVAGTGLRERVPGADLVPLIVERSQSNGSRVLLFGSASGVAESAARLLADRFPQATVSGLSGPYVSDVREIGEEWIDQIVSRRPDIICVALGNPKQEWFIDEFRSRLGASVLIGIGGTLDFIVGGRRRAPRVAQRAGLEWVYRAAQEPGRLGRRYIHDASSFGPLLLGAGIGRLRARSEEHGGPTPMTTNDHRTVIDLSGHDLRGVADVARLVAIHRDGIRGGIAETILTRCPVGALEVLRTHRVADLFTIQGEMPKQMSEE